MAWTRKKAVGQKVRCEAITDRGEPCKAFAIRETYEGLDDPQPRCRIHSLSKDELSLMARRMAAASATVRKGDVEAAPRLSGLSTEITLAELLPIVREALEAKFEYTHEINWNVRLAACGVLLSAFPREYRRTPEDCAELLRRAIPPEILSPELLETEKAFVAMRKAWDEIDGLRWSELKGFFVAPYPAHMVAPWENTTKLQGRRPRPVPPDKAPVMKLPDGTVALEREHMLPMALPIEQPPAEDEAPAEGWPEMLDTDAVAW